MDYLFEIIVKKPECEETILIDLINKLVDPLSEISNYAIQDLQGKYMKMSLVILNIIKTFFTSTKSNNTKYNALVYLN